MGNQINNNVLVLYPVIIQGLKKPVIHDANPDGGIPLSLFDEYPEGLLCLIDPWINAASRSVVMAVDDRVDLFVVGRAPPVAGKTINPGEENDRVRLFIPKGILQEGINEIYYKVRRVGQTTPEESLTLKVLFHTLAPGEPGHSARKVQVSADVQTKGVDRAQADRGVVTGMDYSNRRAYDDIRLSIGTTYVDHKVTPAEAAPGSPVVTETLFTPVFERIGDNPRTPFRFSVTDQLGNSSGQSAILEIDVHLQQPALDLRPPSVLEANGTLLNIQEDFYDAEFATVQVAFTGSAPRQTVKVYWVGRNSTYGSEIQTIEYSGQTLTFKVKRIDVIDCIGKVAKVYYTVQRSIDPMPLESRPLHLSVTQVGNLVLTEPRLSSDKRTAMVSYVGMSTGYSVRIAWHGRYKRYGAEFNITNTSEMRLPIESSWITESAGLPVQINYTILRTGSGEKLRFSWVLRLHL
ncbi:hypothetical protein [Pseudomonas lini]|uniref:Uncharacterized protein n=1 Tax=Pseudomonas lini TaxID=163011 RepID=A0A7V7P6P9_9PSED|nr:hypothetical protein [Pseudomonas lini]KAB0507013.1 hypothetical protein F7R14_03850 [Pseudomonas lini]KMM88410.1 hypothetical protein TU81_27665 [Pseudomonas lini]